MKYCDKRRRRRRWRGSSFVLWAAVRRARSLARWLADLLLCMLARPLGRVNAQFPFGLDLIDRLLGARVAFGRFGEHLHKPRAGWLAGWLAARNQKSIALASPPPASQPSKAKKTNKQPIVHKSRAEPLARRAWRLLAIRPIGRASERAAGRKAREPRGAAPL